MKRVIGLAALLLLATTVSTQADSYVRGYYKSNGTYVAPHYRSSPDGIYNNNYGVKPNINPYTGQRGTLSPTWNNRAPSYNGLNTYSNGLNTYRSRRW